MAAITFQRLYQGKAVLQIQVAAEVVEQAVP